MSQLLKFKKALEERAKFIEQEIERLNKEKGMSFVEKSYAMLLSSKKNIHFSLPTFTLHYNEPTGWFHDEVITLDDADIEYFKRKYLNKEKLQKELNKKTLELKKDYS